jgi:hypothetical protein
MNGHPSKTDLLTRLRAFVLQFETPEQIRRVVGRWDWAVFWLIAVLTALVFWNVP